MPQLGVPTIPLPGIPIPPAGGPLIWPPPLPAALNPSAPAPAPPPAPAPAPTPNATASAQNRVSHLDFQKVHNLRSFGVKIITTALL